MLVIFKLTKNIINKLAVGAAEVESLKIALAEAKKEAKARKVAADKVAKEIEVEQTARRRHEAWVEEVEQELKDAIARCELSRPRCDPILKELEGPTKDRSAS